VKEGWEGAESHGELSNFGKREDEAQKKGRVIKKKRIRTIGRAGTEEKL